MKIPNDILQAAIYFIEANEARDEANEAQDHDKAFEIECDQRDYGNEMALWIIKNQGDLIDV